MKAVTLFTDQISHHRLMQIDLDVVAQNEDLLEDIYDLLTIEVRKNDETMAWDEVKARLQNQAGKN